jgi:DHA1 family multidrug resistance protein-like MFS transporter
MRFLTQMGRMMPIPILPFFIETLTIPSFGLNTFVGLVQGVSAGTTTLSSIYLGRLGDRIGHRKVLRASLLAAGLLFIPQSMVNTGWQLFTLQALTGVAVGGVIPSISALLARFTQPGEEGSVYGLDNSINAGGRAVAPLIGSWVGGWFNLRATFLTTGLILLLTTLLASTIIPKPPVNPAEE